MRACGIVAEFNPLHKGHEYIMNEARSLSDCDALVIAMSGDYVQRGEPAITDKWDRTRSALSSGADLVIEIPTLFCLGNAGQYAGAGVRLLEALACTETIYCGSESGNSKVLKKLAGLLKSDKYDIENRIRTLIKTGISYPAARECAVMDILSLNGESASDIREISDVLHNSNDILTLEYLMAAESADVYALKRKGASYNDEFKEGIEYQSASGIRELLYEGSAGSIERAMSAISPESYQYIDFNKLTFPGDWTEALRYALMITDAEDIEDCPSGGEGLGHALKEAAVNCSTMKEIINSVKSRRYTYTRISRLCMQLVLRIRRRDYPFESPEYVRVLGFNKNGRELLSYIKKKDMSKLPIITNINKESEYLGSSAKKMMELDVSAADIYNLISGRSIREYSDRVVGPVIAK